MARPAESYRGARRNAWRAQKPKPPWITGMEPPRYVPYRCKPPRMRYGTFQVGNVPNAINDVMVPYTDLRKQPQVYRGGFPSVIERRWSKRGQPFVHA